MGVASLLKECLAVGITVSISELTEVLTADQVLELRLEQLLLNKKLEMSEERRTKENLDLQKRLEQVSKKLKEKEAEIQKMRKDSERILPPAAPKATKRKPAPKFKKVEEKEPDVISDEEEKPSDKEEPESDGEEEPPVKRGRVSNGKAGKMLPAKTAGSRASKARKPPAAKSPKATASKSPKVPASKTQKVPDPKARKTSARKARIATVKAQKSASVKKESEIEDEKKYQEFEVEAILDERVKEDGGREYLVHFKAWPKSLSTWEPEANLNCKVGIAAFRKKKLREVLFASVNF